MDYTNKHASGDHGENMIAVLTNNERKFVMVDYDHTSSPPNSPLKHCSKCGETKPCAAFSKKKDTRDGLRLHCKQCAAKYHSDNADKISERHARWYRENAAKVSERHARWYRENAAKVSEGQARYYLENADKLRESSARYYRENAAKLREHNARYYRENAAKLREHNAQWRQANPAKARANNQRRRATKRALPSRWTDTDAQQMLAYWGNRCAICEQKVESNNAFYFLAADHWIALTSPECPGTVPWNMLPLCHSRICNAAGCNNAKSDADPIAWLNSLYPDDPKLVAKILARIAKYFKFIETDGGAQ